MAGDVSRRGLLRGIAGAANKAFANVDDDVGVGIAMIPSSRDRLERDPRINRKRDRLRATWLQISLTSKDYYYDLEYLCSHGFQY